MTKLMLKIEHDVYPINPRTEYDNLGTMVCFHKRYTLGDETDMRVDWFEDWDEMEKHLIEEEKAEVILPVSLYDHSGIKMTVGTASGWDCGQVGFIYMTGENMLSAFNEKTITDALLKRATEALEAEVATYNQYLTGEVYGFVVEDDDGNIVDSCYDIYGREEVEREGEVSLKFYQDLEDSKDVPTLQEAI